MPSLLEQMHLRSFDERSEPENLGFSGLCPVNCGKIMHAKGSDAYLRQFVPDCGNGGK